MFPFLKLNTAGIFFSTSKMKRVDPIQPPSCNSVCHPGSESLACVTSESSLCACLRHRCRLMCGWRGWEWVGGGLCTVMSGSWLCVEILHRHKLHGLLLAERRPYGLTDCFLCAPWRGHPEKIMFCLSLLYYFRWYKHIFGKIGMLHMWKSYSS